MNNIDNAVCVWLEGKTFWGPKYWFRKWCTGPGNITVWMEHEGPVPARCPDCKKEVKIINKDEQ
jgi:hypothetical protein